MSEVELQHGVLLLHDDVAEPCLLFRGSNGKAQILHVEARHGIPGHELRQRSIYGILGDMVQSELQVSDDIQMSHVEEAPLGLVRILARLVII